MAHRCCGRRQAGGIYFEVALARAGQPLEHFLLDPPIVIDPVALGLSPVGVQLIEREGQTHVLDWVGSDHYPNVADVLEECRQLGLSRRAASTLDFSRLGPGSRILLVHRRAHIENPAPYWAAIGEDRACPRAVATARAHLAPDYTAMCAGLWWHDIEGGTPLANGTVMDRRVYRPLPSGGYFGASRPVLPAAVWRPAYQPALFLSLPLTHLAVIADPAGETHQAALRQAGRSRLPVNLVDA